MKEEAIMQAACAYPLNTFSLNFLAIGIAVVANLILGGIWYTPVIFGDKWAKLAGFGSMKELNPGWWTFAAMIVTGFLTALGIALIMNYTQCRTLWQGVLTGLFVSVLFIVPAKSSLWIFEKKFMLFVLEAGFLAISCIVMGAVIGLLQ